MKKRNLFVISVAIVVLIVSVFMFAACDDKDKGDKGNDKPLTFEEGTTLENIIAMVDNDEITSCSVSMIVGNINSGDKTEYRYDIRWATNCLTQVITSYSDEENCDEYIVAYVYYIYEDGICYSIIGNTRELGIEWDITKNQSGNDSLLDYPSAYLKDLLTPFTEHIDGIVIDGDKVSLKYIDNISIDSKNYAEYVLYDFNCTNILELPDEVKNYKELAVEREED